MGYRDFQNFMTGYHELRVLRVLGLMIPLTPNFISKMKRKNKIKEKNKKKNKEKWLILNFTV